uniref:Uncharacterized protein n=1 Tax=Triticum urartu TaxID=4572 RepID=A0A8R7R3Z9_TRIUA
MHRDLGRRATRRGSVPDGCGRASPLIPFHLDGGTGQWPLKLSLPPPPPPRTARTMLPHLPYVPLTSARRDGQVTRRPLPP